MKYFLDTNIIVDWILIKEKIENEKELEEDGLLRKRFKEKSFSYTLLEIFLNVEKDVEVVTCDFAWAEAYSIIYDEIICKKLYMEGIPYRMWNKLRKYKELRGDAIDVFRSQVINDFEKLKTRIETVKDEVDDEIFPLLFHKSRMGIYDAMILTTAIVNKADYFVTQDKDIVNVSKKPFFKFPMELTNPRDLLKEFENK